MSAINWGQIKETIKTGVGHSNYSNWFEPINFLSVEDGIARLQVPSKFIGDYVSKNFGDFLLHHLSTQDQNIQRLSFELAASKKTLATPTIKENEPALSQRVSRKTMDGDIPGAPLDPRFTFENFVVGKPNELAYAAAKRVAEAGPVTFNPLFLYGGVGLGKTHLMHSISWELHQNRPELNVIYLSAEQFMYQFVRALREKKMIDFKELFRTVDVLMIDDVQFIAGKESTQEEFFHTFNALVDQNKQIIITADQAPGEIRDLGDRITSRLQSGLVVDLHPTTYELRLGILQKKLDLQRITYPSLEIDNDVLEFLAARISTNVRVLEGALTRLIAFASLVNRNVTLELAQDCLADTLRNSERRVSVEDIQRKVADHYNIKLSDMIGPKRSRSIARPRQIAMFLSKELTSRSLPEIGKRFGGRDHTTVIHGVKRIEGLKNQDDQIAEDLKILQRSLDA